jgi:hypothetical protein
MYANFQDARKHRLLTLPVADDVTSTGDAVLLIWSKQRQYYYQIQKQRNEDARRDGVIGSALPCSEADGIIASTSMLRG